MNSTTKIYRATRTVYINYTWRRGQSHRYYQLYKSVSEKPLKNLGRSESSTLFCEPGDILSNSIAHHSLVWRAAMPKLDE